MLTPGEAIAKGNSLLRQGRYRDAIRVLEEPAHVDLTNWRLQCVYAEALIQSDRFREALAAARTAEQLHPASPLVLQMVGEAQLGLRETREAALTANRIVELAPSSAVGYDLRGRIALKEKHYNEAEVDFRHAVDLEPHNWALNNNLGLALRHLKRDREAVVVLERAVAANPRSRIARRNLFGATSAYIAAGGLIVVLAAIRALPAIAVRYHIPLPLLSAVFFGGVVIALIARWLWSRHRLHQLGPRAVELYHHDWLRQTVRSTLRYAFRILPIVAVITAVLILGTFSPIGFLVWIIAGGVVIVAWWFVWQPLWRRLAALVDAGRR